MASSAVQPVAARPVLGDSHRSEPAVSRPLIGHSSQGQATGFVWTNLVFSNSDSDSVIVSIHLGLN